MKAGYTSVMIDGSHEDFENNIAVTKKVVDVANAFGIPVEAELGKVGGKEDDLDADADTNTDPQEAKEFVERTGSFLSCSSDWNSARLLCREPRFLTSQE